jgi:hypothetical protein
MRTFKYSYIDSKGFKKDGTVEADSKDDAYIILKTMRINPLSIAETEAEDISLEILGQPDEKEIQRRINYAGRPVAAGVKKKGEVDLEQVITPEELRHTEPLRRERNWQDLVMNAPPFLLFALFALGVASIGWSAWATASETAELSWPQARATIVHSDMLVIGMFSKTYKPDIWFTYRANGETYTTNSVFSHPIPTTRGDCVSLMGRYQVDRRVYCRYNEEDPSRAFIEFTGEAKSHLFSAILGLGFFSAAIGLFVLRQLNEPEKKAKRKARRASAKPKDERIVIEA